MICINPNCPDKYVGPIYFGISGEGKATLQSRMNDHIGQFDNTGAAGVDCHFAGECKDFMRFLFLKQISDLRKRKSICSKLCSYMILINPSTNLIFFMYSKRDAIHASFRDIGSTKGNEWECQCRLIAISKYWSKSTRTWRHRFRQADS